MRKLGLLFIGMIISSQALSATIYVGNGLPFTSVQAGINAAAEGDTVIVMPGRYLENIYFNGKNIAVRSQDPQDPEIRAITTIQSAAANTPVVRFRGTETFACELAGFTITGADMGTHGGGIQGNGCKATIRWNVITDNWALDYRGGGIWAVDGLIANCMIVSNYAGYGGGLADCKGKVIDCVVAENYANLNGFAMANCTTVVNCTVINAGYYSSDRGLLTGCNGVFGNCIFYTPSGYYGHQSSPQLIYCCWPGATTENNIDADPWLRDMWGGDYRLHPQSPCVNAGKPDYFGDPGEQDIYGNPRIFEDRMDIGAMEYHGQPTAYAGYDRQVNEIGDIVLEGRASYLHWPEGTIEYAWAQVSGPQAVLSDPASAVTPFTPSEKGIYEFVFTVTNNGIVSDPDTVRIQVGNMAPVTIVQPCQLAGVGSTVMLDASGSCDPDVISPAPLAFQWTQTGGLQVDLYNADTPTASFVVPERGIYTFQLQVFDGYDYAEPVSVEVTTAEFEMTVNPITAGYTTSDAFHFPYLSHNQLVVAAGNACDFTWNIKLQNLDTLAVTSISPIADLETWPKLDGSLLVWCGGINGNQPWGHEPSNVDVIVMDLKTQSRKRLREHTWSESYSHPAVSGKTVVWVEHRNLDPRPTGSSEAINWWNTPFNICGADLTNFSNPRFFTIATNVGNRDPYPCHNYSGDADQALDISGPIVVWEADGDIYGADITNPDEPQVFVICDAPGKQFNPSISGNIVLWTDGRYSNFLYEYDYYGTDIYGADISNRNAIVEFAVAAGPTWQSQARIYDGYFVYVETEYDQNTEGTICLGWLAGGRIPVRIPLAGNPIGFSPTIHHGRAVWQTSTYGELAGVSFDLMCRAFDGPVRNTDTGTTYYSVTQACTEAAEGQTIIVEPGIYNENVYLNGADITLRSTQPGAACMTVLHGVWDGRAVCFAGTESQACVLEGFTITGGSSYHGGAGVVGLHNHATIRNCVVVKNREFGYGGGGIGGTHGLIENCIIADNHALKGGGLFLCDGIVRNCLIVQNTASGIGNAVADCNGQFVNCTVATYRTNKPISNYLLTNCRAAYRNCVFDYSDSIDSGSVPAEVLYCCFKHATSETNVRAEPGFVNPAQYDFRLSAHSPCIDAGDNASAADILTDLDWRQRIIAGTCGGAPTVDIGAFEWFCAADIAGECGVDLEDFAVFAAAWMNADCSGQDWCGGADLNRSGDVGMEDFLLMADQWLIGR